mmetsp:Transcript_48775/g.35897  ORF Transcript_48775/g.35897 Transcript_48775/m.35897 type:complete len:164 (-) Transcript_48775:32-523(-)
MEDKYAAKAVSFTSASKPPTEYSDDPNKYTQLKGLNSDLIKQRQLEEANKPKGLFQRKMERIFGALGDVRSMFFNGFKIGFVVGSIFGGLMGTYYAIIYRTIIYIPTAAVGSGASFGFFMGIGAVMRTEMEAAEEKEEPLLVKSFDPASQQIAHKPIYYPYIL